MDPELGSRERTLKNLYFIKKNASSTEVHPVMPVVNSLLGLLVFPVAEKEKSEKEKTCFATFSEVKFKLRPIRSGAKLCRAQALLPVLRRLYGGRR